MSDLKIREYRELRPANVYDVAANETWLEDMAREGCHLKRFTGWGAVFEKGKPAECRYRMQPLPGKGILPDEEQMGLYRRLGWEYIAVLGKSFTVWRCIDSAAPELDTDPVVQREGWRWLKGRMLRSALQGVLLLAVILAFWGVLGGLHAQLLYMLESYVPGEFLIRQLAGDLILLLMFCEVRAMVRLLKTLKNGIPLARPRPYRAQRWLARLLLFTFVLICVLPWLAGRTTSGNSLRDGWWLDMRDQLPEEAVCLDARELDGDLGTEDAEWVSSRTKVLELAPRMYFIQQYVAPNRFANTDYYRLLSEPLAPMLVEELCRQRQRFDEKPMEELRHSGLDAFWWSQDDRTGDQYIVCSRGNQVLAAAYRGPTDLREAGDYLAEKLA